MKSHQLVNQDSGSQEWYTPLYILNLVRELLGEIELDPASNEIANKNVMAKRIITKEENALEQEWKAKTLWLNHPFGKGEKACKKYKAERPDGLVYCCKKTACIERGYHIDETVPGNADWIKKVSSEFNAGNFEKGACITLAATSEDWFKPLYDHVQVFLYKRVNFVNKQGEEIKGVTKGCIITCFGFTVEQVERVFGNYGKVK